MKFSAGTETRSRLWIPRREFPCAAITALAVIAFSAELAQAQTVTEIIDSTGDGTNSLTEPRGVAADSAGNVYVAGDVSDNVFKITPGGTITQIIDSTGDGTNPLSLA